MPLWGNSDAVEAKPKHFTDAEKLNVYATEKGWVKKITGTGGRANRIQEEVIVAIGDLGAALNLADITAIDWNIDSFDKSDGGTLSVTVTFNEPVEVNTADGTPTLTVTNDTNSNHTLLYTGGTGTNRLTFELAIAAANAATDADDVLSIAANCVALASGTITEMSTEHFTLESGADEFIRLEGVGVGYINQEVNTASTITSSSAIGTAAGSITVAA
jgi:hypothetical protein|tara:strand:- start:56 stop:706 length:651 start_codon:yes stop_codon:yes gene_type:complete